MKTFPTLFVLCFFMISTTLFSEEPAVPTPGKQVVQSVELPASTSIWDFDREGIGRIGDPRPLDESKTDTLRYWLFLPADYETQAQSGGAPLLLFLHGAGERGKESGEDIAKVKVHSLPRLLDNPEFAKNFPCVTVSPQCKNGFAWSPAQLMLLLDHIEANYKIDKSRVYVTGLSMGGFGTWMCLNESPQRFAAAAAVCGGAKPEWAEKLINVPIWAFHGDKDTLVTVDRSQNMVDAIRAAGGSKIFFTIYEGVGHDSWTQTYNNQLLYDWMFQQTLKGTRSYTGYTDALPSSARVPTVEKQIGDRNTFKVRTHYDNVTDEFSLIMYVKVRKADELKFDRRYEQATVEIIDHVTAILNVSTTEERKEVRRTAIRERAIRERVKKAINAVLGTPWVQDVLFTEIVHEIL